MSKCDICKKTIAKASDSFMVRKNLWKSYCETIGIPESGRVCTECYEKVMGEIKASDLDLPQGCIFPINFWLVRKLGDPNLIPFVQNQRDRTAAAKEVGVIFSRIEVMDDIIRACDTLIEELSAK